MFYEVVGGFATSMLIDSELKNNSKAKIAFLIE